MQASFGSLFELVDYYKKTPLENEEFNLLLREAVPPVATHERKSWFHKISRSDAEAILRRIAVDGSYLVRQSESSANGYAVTFRFVWFIYVGKLCSSRRNAVRKVRSSTVASRKRGAFSRLAEWSSKAS